MNVLQAATFFYFGWNFFDNCIGWKWAGPLACLILPFVWLWIRFSNFNLEFLFRFPWVLFVNKSLCYMNEENSKYFLFSLKQKTKKENIQNQPHTLNVNFWVSLKKVCCLLFSEQSGLSIPVYLNYKGFQNLMNYQSVQITYFTRTKI